jgi:protein-tyrosine phosphatase
MRTSTTHPIRVDWVTENIGITFAPGKKARSAFGGAWHRNLSVDLDRLKNTYKVHTLVSLIEDHELERLSIPNLVKECTDRGMTIFRSPVPDGYVPEQSQAQAIVRHALQVIKEGNKVVFHCKGGLGRAGTLCACTIKALGAYSQEAIDLTRKHRPGAIENPGQENFIRNFRL